MHGRLLLGVVGTAILVVGCAQSDSGITSSVKSKLVADDFVKARNISVDTQDRVVTLTGTVQSAIEESRAIEIARNTSGVADVVDKMSVASAEPGAAPTTGLDTAPATSVGGAISDAAITSDVRARLLADADVNRAEHRRGYARPRGDAVGNGREPGSEIARCRTRWEGGQCRSRRRQPARAIYAATGAAIARFEARG